MLLKSSGHICSFNILEPTTKGICENTVALFPVSVPLNPQVASLMSTVEFITLIAEVPAVFPASIVTKSVVKDFNNAALIRSVDNWSVYAGKEPKLNDIVYFFNWFLICFNLSNFENIEISSTSVFLIGVAAGALENIPTFSFSFETSLLNSMIVS